MAKKESLLNIILDVNLEGKSGGWREFSLKSVIIGNGPAVNLHVEDPSVSSIHAILKTGEYENTALLNDLGSGAGTKVNGKEIQREATVKRGDRIQIGDVEILVVEVGAEHEETEPTEPVKKVSVMTEEESLGRELLKEKEPTPVQRPPMRREERAAPPKRGKPPSSPRTTVVRRREIPKVAEFVGAPSGQNFFERDMLKMEQPRQESKLLEVKVMWGPIVLDVYQFGETDSVDIGDNPAASIRITTDRLGGEIFTLASPGGTAGHVVHVASGMELEVRHGGKSEDVGDLPSAGAVQNYALKMGDKCRVMMGQLAFLLQYVKPARGLSTGLLVGADYQMSKWLLVFLVLAIGLWGVVQATPKTEVEVSDYLKNPARFAKLITTQKPVEKKTFEEIKKKKEEKVNVEDTGKWKRVTTQSKAKSSKEIPREIKEKQDRKIATSAGILGLLKGRGGGTGDNASSVFGGSAMASLDQQLAGLRSSGMGDSGGFGGLGTRGGGPGGGGGGLGLGGLGTAGYGRGSGQGYGSIKIGHRGKYAVQVVKGRTRVIGGLSQEVVGHYIKRYWAQFKYCYERELSKDPNLYGKVTITFTIAGNGRVSEAQVIQTTMHNANVEECVLRVIRRIRFPQPKGGGQVIVTYPFMFTTAG